MIRSEASAALNDLYRHCVEVAENYRDSGQEGVPERASALWETLAAQRREFADRLADELRSLGELPGAPNADRHDVAALAEHVRAELANDEFEVALDARLADEVQIQDLCQRALVQDLTPSAEKLVSDLLQSAETARQSLRSNA